MSQLSMELAKNELLNGIKEITVMIPSMTGSDTSLGANFNTSVAKVLVLPITMKHVLKMMKIKISLALQPT